MNSMIRSRSAQVLAISFLGLLVLPLVSLIFLHDVHAQSMPGIKTYVLREYGMIFEYPEDWSVNVVSASEVDLAPPAGSVSVAVSDATGYDSVGEFTDELIAYYKALLSNLEVVESVDVTFAAHPGHRLVITASEGETETKLMQVYTIIDHKVYVITYGALIADYQTSLADVNAIISSFEIDSSIIPVRLSGAYANDELGLQIDFPEGWNGLQNKNENGTQIVLVPADGRKISMVLIAVNTSMSRGGTGDDPFAGCDHSFNFQEINDVTAFAFEGECDREEGFIVMKAYVFGLEDGMLIAMLAGPSRAAFNSGVQEFDSSIRTLSLENSVNVLSASIIASAGNENWVSGDYVNSEAGFSMKLPQGWRGYENATDSLTQFIALPPLNEKEVGVIVIDLFDMASYNEEHEFKVVGDIEYVTLNEHSALRAQGEGEVQNVKLKFSGYTLTTDDKVISITYAAPTAADYDAYKTEFEQSVKTLAIKDTVDVTTYVPLSTDFMQSERTVTVDDKPYAVKVASTSNVTGVELSQEESRLSLTLHGESIGNGTSFVTLSAVLEGPYVVTVDGAPADFDTINDPATNQTTLAVNHPRSTQSIVVAGTRVIPEFPFTAFSAIAIILGLVIAMTTSKVWRPCT